MTEAIRLIATDVDGTLLDRNRRISRTTRAVFQDILAKRGVQFALASSRMPASLDRIEEALGVPCWKIAYDGSKVVGPAPERQAVSQGDTIAIDDALNLIESHSMAMSAVYLDDEWFCNSDTTWSQRESHNTEVKPKITDSIIELVKDRKSDIYKIMFRDSEANIRTLISTLGGRHFASARWFSNSSTILEVVPKSANKADSLNCLLKKLRLKKEDILFFGDGANDVTVFETFRNSVAVDNAIPQLKQIAELYTDRGDENGVANFLVSKFLSS